MSPIIDLDNCMRPVRHHALIGALIVHRSIGKKVNIFESEKYIGSYQFVFIDCLDLWIRGSSQIAVGNSSFFLISRIYWPRYDYAISYDCIQNSGKIQWIFQVTIVAWWWFCCTNCMSFIINTVHSSKHLLLFPFLCQANYIRDRRVPNHMDLDNMCDVLNLFSLLLAYFISVRLWFRLNLLNLKGKNQYSCGAIISQLSMTISD